MFYFLFPSHRLHIQYKALPVSYKVLDLKWAIYQKCWLAPERRSKKRVLEKCASQKPAQSLSEQVTEDDSDDACQIKTLQVTKRNGGGKMSIYSRGGIIGICKLYKMQDLHKI